MQQNIFIINKNYSAMDALLSKSEKSRLFLVCGDSIYQHRALYEYFLDLKKRLGINVVRFSDFSPNPTYESVVKGVKLFNESGATQIVAIGGGSAMDVAKCIKLFSNMNPNTNYLEQKVIPNDIKLLAIPTTAGTGSEATRYAVIYYNGSKQSISDFSCIPTDVVYDPSMLISLSVYQKKATMLDALSHAVESMWSVNSNDKSKKFSREAIKLIIKNKEAYISGDSSVFLEMFRASYLAGRAINITQTTAGHAMCYKLTGLYGIPHGYAAALVNSKLFPWMVKNTDKCIDAKGEEYLKSMFADIANTFEVESAEQAAECFAEIVRSLDLGKIKGVKQEDFEILGSSVNPVRLKNNPVQLDSSTIDSLYHEILEK